MSPILLDICPWYILERLDITKGENSIFVEQNMSSVYFWKHSCVLFKSDGKNYLLCETCIETVPLNIIYSPNVSRVILGLVII